MVARGVGWLGRGFAYRIDIVAASLHFLFHALHTFQALLIVLLHLSLKLRENRNLLVMPYGYTAAFQNSF